MTSVVPATGVAVNDLLMAAAAAEIRSEHPLGKAIGAHARSTGVAITEPADFHYTPGRGIVATTAYGRVLVGNEAWLEANGVQTAGFAVPNDGAATAVYVTRDGRLLGAIAVADTVRPEAHGAIDSLHKRNIRTILLTGDNRRVADAIAHGLGITEVAADLLPEAKVAYVRKLVSEGRTVAMVGDGINDAPALAEASVGVAMGSGTDVARESADVVLLGNDLARFVETIAVARWTRRIIYQNFVGTVLVDVLGVIAALAGLIGPVIAINIHTISELVFISNAARLLPRRWDPFKKWSQAYNSWNVTTQWALAATVMAAIAVLLGILYVNTHAATIEGPLGTVQDKLYGFAQAMVSLGGLALLVGIGLLAASAIRKAVRRGGSLVTVHTT